MAADNANGAKYHQKQKNSHCCGATAVAVGMNILLGESKFDGLAVWNSKQMGQDTKHYDLVKKTESFIKANKLGGKLKSFAIAGGRDTKSTDYYKKALEKGYVVISSSGAGAKFRHKDGTYKLHNGHWIVFYRYENGVFYANDSSQSKSKGAGAPYKTADLKQWLNARDVHAAFCIGLK